MYGFFRIVVYFLLMQVLSFSLSYGMLHTVIAQDCSQQESQFCLYEFKLLLSCPVELVSKNKKIIKGVTVEQFFLPGVQSASTINKSIFSHPYNDGTGYGFVVQNTEEGVLISVSYNPDIIIFHYDLPIELRNCLDTVIMFYFYDKKIKDTIEQKSNPIISLAYSGNLKKTVVV